MIKFYVSSIFSMEWWFLFSRKKKLFADESNHQNVSLHNYFPFSEAFCKPPPQNWSKIYFMHIEQTENVLKILHRYGYIFTDRRDLCILKNKLKKNDGVQQWCKTYLYFMEHHMDKNLNAHLHAYWCIKTCKHQNLYTYSCIFTRYTVKTKVQTNQQ